MTDYHAINEARNDLVAADQLLQAAAHHHGRGELEAARGLRERAFKRVERALALLHESHAGGQEALDA